SVETEPHSFKRLAFLRREPACLPGSLLPPGRPRADACRSRADRVERVIEISPARHAIDPGVRAKRARVGAPSGDRRLRGEDLLGGHALEPVVPGVELAHMVEAQPAPLAGPVEIR